MRSAAPQVHGRKLGRLLLENRLAISTGILVMLVLPIYAFFITAGTWRTWPEISRYYDQLAWAFGKGHLYLEVEAPAELRLLPDPYDPQARDNVPSVKAFVDQVWDASYYDRRFYLYWGPVPALCLTLVKQFYAPPIADQYLVFAFLAGLLVFVSLLLLRLAKRHYPDAPLALILLSVLVAALVCPIPWMLSRPAIYEAAIAASQFFLVGGLYFAYRALDRETPSRPRLLFAGIFWVLATGSRLLVILPAAFLILTTCVWLVRKNGAQGKVREAAANLLSLGLPFGLGLLGLGWYNWARFGSVFETGFRYQLTSTNLNQFYSETFSLSYVLPNLWFYLLNPIGLRASFPFLRLTYGQYPSFLDPSSLRIFHLEEIAGLAFVAPFVVFACVPAWKAISRLWTKDAKQRGLQASKGDQLLEWICVSLIGSSLLSFAALLAYFYVAMRLLADVVPSLVLLSAIGVWEGHHYVRQRHWGKQLYVLFAALMAGASIAASTCLTIAFYYRRFQHLNPQLFKSIQRLFTQ